MQEARLYSSWDDVLEFAADGPVRKKRRPKTRLVLLASRGEATNSRRTDR
jgi:hypothetical protein